MDFLLHPRIRNLILEGNDGISAGLWWRGQTDWMAVDVVGFFSGLGLVDGHRVR